MRALAIIGFAMSVAACAGPNVGGNNSAAHEPVPLAAKQREAIEAAVKAKLKDPDSAKFGEIRAGRSRNGHVNVCGLVNARNGFGGYTGMQPFTATFVDPIRVDNIDFDDAGDGLKLASMGCRNIAPGLLAIR